jgi:hypothetical protein
MLLIAALCALVVLSGAREAMASSAVAAWGGQERHIGDRHGRPVLSETSMPLGDGVVFSLGARSTLEEGGGAGHMFRFTDASDVLTADTEERVELGRDWPGIGKDTALFVGYQVAFGSILYLLPESATGADKSTVFDTWDFNVRHPTWDPDPWFVNYVSHPYWGAAYYVRARERGFGEIGSFLYSVLLSTLFEYSIESFFEPPSYQDLIVTPVAGALIGALVFEPLRARIKSKPEFEWHDHLIMAATDPLGALNGVFDWLFGIKSDIRLQFRPLAGAQRDGIGANAASPLSGHRASRRRAPEVGMGLILRY